MRALSECITRSGEAQKDREKNGKQSHRYYPFHNNSSNGTKLRAEMTFPAKTLPFEFANFGRKRGVELLPLRSHVLADHFYVAQHWQEVRVPIPARDDMPVQMIVDAGAGYAAQVHPDI